MRDITLEELLEAGCHFGHQINRRNPKADEFIFEARSGINIINLESTREGLIKAAEFLKNLSAKGGYVIVVGTKRQARGIVKEEIERARQAGAKNIFYVTSRWIGGLLTNYQEVSKNFKKLKNIEKLLQSGNDSGYTKREMVLFEKEKNKLTDLYGGVVDMERVPDALYIIDTHNEVTASREAKEVGIEVAGIVDTNADPAVVDYAIPANDDAVGSIKLITNYLIDAWIEGQKEVKTSSSAKALEDKQKLNIKKEEEETEKSTEAKKDGKKEVKEEKVKTETKVKTPKAKKVEPVVEAKA